MARANSKTPQKVLTAINYDSLNRVVSRIVEHPSEPFRNRVITYAYQNGVLVSKSYTSGSQDVHTYTDGLLTLSSRSWDGEHSYQYNGQAQLIGSTGDDYFYDCDGIIGADSTPSFSLNYSGSQVSSIVSIVGDYSLDLNYSNQRFDGFTEEHNCGAVGFVDNVAVTINYDSDNRPTSISRNDELFVSNVVINYGENGKVSRVVETDSDGTTTTELSYNDEGLVLEQVVNNDIASTFFVYPDYTALIGYEDGTCVVSLSSNPAKLAIVESFLAGRGVDPYVNCGYSLDENEF
ncbi:MAG: hypothetical protein AB8B79_21290 [Granulosicoccus sp.]